MKKLLCGLLALMMTVTLLPFSAVAEEPTSWASQFRLTASMNVEAYPEEDQEILQGVADLLDMLEITGLARWSGKCFDGKFDVVLEEDESTRTGFRLYGLDTHWGVESTLFGEQSLMINNLALLEFAIKAYNHLDLPLQYIALAICPYATTSAFEWIMPLWQETLGGEGSRIIDRDAVLALCNYMAENGESNREFYYWICALLAQAGYSDSVFESMAVMGDWAEENLGEDGITITVEGDQEIWSTGDVTLFAKNGDSWSLTLPPSLEGGTIAASLEAETGVFKLEVVDSAEDTVLDLTVTADNLPTAYPFEGTCTVNVNAQGAMLENEVGYAFQIDGYGKEFVLRQMNAETGEEMLTVILATGVEEISDTVIFSPTELDGVNILSVDDNSLKEFVLQVMDPFLKGFMPLLFKMPASSYASLFGLLEQYGIMDVLTAGLE